MEKKLDLIVKELRVVKKLLAAGLYLNGVSSDDIGKITGMNAGDVRKLVTKRKKRLKKDAK